jgi:site-specific recombinase XerC
MSVFARYFTTGEERQLLRTVARCTGSIAARDHAWMRLLRYTGLRVDSLASLRVQDALDAIREGVLRPPRAKGARAYEVPVSRRARVALQDLLRVRRALGHAQDPDAPLIMSRHRRGLSVRSLQARMQHWVHEAGLPAGSPHWWRHTLAQRVLEHSTAREPLRVVQRVLCHASRSSTAIYTQPTKEEVALSLEEGSA